jgi:hypothetical protein
MIENNGYVANHQFSFIKRHSTTEQTHHVVQRINEALENKQYCSAAFLDISQAFDKVWHTGLLYKLKLFLPLNCFIVLKSYLHSRYFLVRVKSEHKELSSVKAVSSQGNVPGPSYTCYTCTGHLPTSTESTTATSAADTAVLAISHTETQKLQTNQNTI